MRFLCAVFPAIAVLFVTSVFGDDCLSSANVDHTVTEDCLSCICEAASNCDPDAGCDGDVCGPFKITKPYWIDAHRPVLPRDNHRIKGAYRRCTTDEACSRETVRNYMARFAKDCNGDGKIGCADFALIHRFGGYGCRGKNSTDFLDAFSDCWAQTSLRTSGEETTQMPLSNSKKVR